MRLWSHEDGAHNIRILIAKVTKCIRNTDANYIVIICGVLSLSYLGPIIAPLE